MRKSVVLESGPEPSEAAAAHSGCRSRVQLTLPADCTFVASQQTLVINLEHLGISEMLMKILTSRRLIRKNSEIKMWAHRSGFDSATADS